MVERPDEHLAPVIPLFGDPVSQPEVAGRSSAGDAIVGHATVGDMHEAIDAIMARPTRRPVAAPASRAEKRARNVSIAALARRGVSVAEMRDLLVRRELEADVIEQELDRLIDEHLLDDETLAESVIRTSTERKGMGVSAIRAELRRRKIDPEVIEVALGSLDDDDEYERAVGVAVARARQLSSLDPETAERRLIGYLQRRGYGGSTLARAARHALSVAPSGRRGPRFE